MRPVFLYEDKRVIMAIPVAVLPRARKHGR